MNLCKKLRDLPPVLTEWQGTVWCPDCPHYDGGACGSRTRAERNAPCPLDGQPLPLREVAIDPGQGLPQGYLDGAPGTEPLCEPRCEAMERAIRDAIVRRTGTRVRLHEVEVTDSLAAIRGLVPSYYLKQLAIGAVLEVIGSARPIRVDLNVPAAEGAAEAGATVAREGLS